jgi:uncharacterized membrane protein
MITLSVSVWAMLALVVLGMAIYRKVLSNKEDDTMHLADAEVSLVTEQNVLAQKLEVVDKWGKLLTIVVVVYGLVLAGLLLYQGWLEASKG